MDNFPVNLTKTVWVYPLSLAHKGLLDWIWGLRKSCVCVESTFMKYKDWEKVVFVCTELLYGISRLSKDSVQRTASREFINGISGLRNDCVHVKRTPLSKSRHWGKIVFMCMSSLIKISALRKDCVSVYRAPWLNLRIEKSLCLSEENFLVECQE